MRAMDLDMGEVDIAKEYPNVTRMKILGAKLVPVGHGLKTLKEAVDSAFEAYLKDPVNSIYCIGSVVGPHPFPLMVREFQRIVGEESKKQFAEMTNGLLPDHVVACVGGGSNAMGIFTAFIDDPVQLHGVEPLGRGTTLGDHAASLSYGTEGMMHGFNSIMLKDDKGGPAPVYSIASGLDYPSVGPEHAHLKTIGRTNVGTASDDETVYAFFQLSRLEGIIPALESAHAVAYATKLAKQYPHSSILVNLSGRGDKDIDFVMEKWGHYADKEY
jgi:tryptophan synthase beta chain